MTQSTIDFTLHERENSAANEAILNDNRQVFTNQCRIVLKALMRGEQLTTGSAFRIYEIGDLRARIRDLIKHNGIDVSKKLMQGRFKTYYLDQQEINRLKAEGV